MKKKRWIVAIILFLLFVNEDINAKVVKNSKIKIEYNNNTKELWAFGYNKFGNLGTGNTTDVSEANKVNINSKVDNQKIVDYVFTNAQTFILTEAGSVYATGINIGDGNDRDIRTSFRKLTMYNNKIKITYLNLIAIKDNRINLEMLTNNKNQKYLLKHFSLISYPATGTGTWNGDYYINEYSSTTKYLIYKDTKNKDTFIDIIFNAKGKRIYSYNVDKSKKIIIKNIYNNGVITQSKNMSEKRSKVKRYNNGIIKSQTIYHFRKTKKNYMYHRYTAKRYDYVYKNGKLKKRIIKSVKKNKLRTSTIKYYYGNSKGELKSNKNGKASCYVTYYQNGKATVTYKYNYSKNGKMINKTKVKIKKKY